MQFLEKTKKSIFSLFILVLLILSFFVFKFALDKEKIYFPRITDGKIFTDFEVKDLIEGKKIIKSSNDIDKEDLRNEINELVKLGLKRSSAASYLANKNGISKNILYNLR